MDYCIHCAFRGKPQECDSSDCNQHEAWYVFRLKERERVLVKELETERMRLVACGVVAMANTPESATLSRIPKDSPYWSASLGDVENAVDREMALIERERVLREAATYAKIAIDNYIHKEWGVGEIQDAYDKLKAALERKEGGNESYKENSQNIQG